jgi:hypothetical protein
MSDPQFYAGSTLPVDDLQDLGRDDTWTPTLTGSTTNPTMGTGAVIDGDVHWNGRLYTARFNITFGSSGSAAGTGTYQIDLPAALTLDASWAANVEIGGAELNDGGTAYSVSLRSSTATRLIARFRGDAAHGNSAWSTTTVPMGNNDFIRGAFTALAA